MSITPESWKSIKIDLLGELIRGISYKKGDSALNQLKNYLPIIRANNIQEELVVDDLVYVDKKYFTPIQKIIKGDIVFSMSSGSKHLVGKTACAKFDYDMGWGAFCSVFRPHDFINKRFLAYFFKGSEYKKLISSIAKGTNINNLKREHIVELDFPLPPLAEQHRIVAKIEELFSELDKGVEALRSAQAQLKVYRQAVLKYAFEGKLTNQEVNDGELPEGWVTESIKTISSVVRGGSPRPAGDKRYYDGSIPFLKVKDLTRDDAMFVTYAEHSIKEAGLQKTRMVDSGTLLLSNSGATLGVPKITTFNTTMNDGVAAFLDVRCNIKYLYYYWKSKTLELRAIDQGAAQPNLNTEIIREQIINIPKEAEAQVKVVNEIESRLSVCDKIEESIEQGLQQAEALRQSILKRAFEGKLVAQDPNDEPASVLLERIRSERAETKPIKKTRTKKTKS